MRKHRSTVNLMLLLLGSGVSTFGNALVLVALLVYLAGFADSARLIGLVQGSAYLPMALFSYAAGAWVDRHSPRRIMIWTDTMRGLAMIASGLLLAVLPDIDTGGRAGLAVLLPMVFVLGTLQSLFIPGVVLLCMDVERQLAADGRPVRVLGLRNAGTHGATLAGNAIGGSLYLLLGLPALLVYSGLGFILSAISEVFLQESSHSITGSTMAVKMEVSGTSRFHVANPRLPPQPPGAANQPGAAPLPGAAPRVSPPAALLADLRSVISTPPVDLYLLVQILIPFLTMIMPSYLGQDLGLPAQALGLVFALLLAGSITAGLSSGFQGRSNKPTALQPGKAGWQSGCRTGTGGGAVPVSQNGTGCRASVRQAYLPGLLAGLLLAALALPGKLLPLPLGAVLLVGLGYFLGSLYLHSIEAVQNVSLPGRGGRSHGMLESLSSIVTPASYFLGAAVLGSGTLGVGRVSATIWVGGMAVILVGYSLLGSRIGRREKLREK